MEFLNQIKKAVASFTLGALLFGFVTPVANAQLGFTDDAEIPSWAFDAIDELMAQGVIGGNDDGSFAPNRQLNRAEVSKIIVLASGVDLDTTGGPHFPDVAPNAWYYDYVETMYNNGWINGYPDGNFRPEVGINRAEIAKMVVNAFEIDPDTAGAPHFDDVTSGDWFYSYVETAYNYGLMRGYGDGTFGPADPVTRAQTTKIVYDSQLVVTSPTGPAEGTLEVALSSDTPRGTNIPFNATSVPFTTVELTASDDSDVEISSLTFTRLGLGDNDDFDNVWLEIDGFKVGNDKSVNNDDIVELRFNPPVVIPAGQTVVADLVASLDYTDTDRNISHHNRFAVVSADDVASTAANVVGDFPIEGEEMEVASYQVSEIEFETLGSDTTVDVGDNFIEIGKFKLENQSTTNKDVEVRALTFKNDGVAELEDVLENVALYVSGEQVSAETIIDGDYVTFRLDNGVTGGYIIEDGDSRIFSIRADIVSAEKGDTINFKVDNFEDIVGVEIGTSFGVKAISDKQVVLGTDAQGNPETTETSVTNQDAEDNNARLRVYSIDSGDLNVSRDPSSLSNQEYAPGSNDVVFLTARLTVDQPLIVDGVVVTVNDFTLPGDNTLENLNNSFDNFRLFLNDKLIDSENDFGGTIVTPELDFNTTFEIAGTSVLKVVGNIESDADNGSRIKLGVAADNFASPEYISTGDQVESTELLGSAEASFVEVEESILTISKSDGLSTTGERIVAGIDDVTLLEFILDNNDSGDVNVTSISLKAEGAGNAAQFSDYTAAIFVDGKQQGSSKNLTTDGDATFNDLSVVIATADQKEFVVVVDTIESIAGGTLANTTVAVGTGVEVIAGAAVSGANDVTVSAESTIVSIPGGLTAALSDGDEIVVSTSGAPTASGAEIRAVVGDYLIGATSVTVSEAFENGHSLEDASLVTRRYGSGFTSFDVASIANISVGDELEVDGNACTVASISGTRITCTAAIAADVVIGSAVDETTSTDTIQFNVTAVDADNVENGQSVEVTEGGIVLGDNNADTTGNGDCDGGTDDNYLCGATFGVIKSGTLSVDTGTTIYSDLLVSGADKVEVLQVRFNASDDDIEIKDLYLINDLNDNGLVDAGEADFGERADFTLADASGNEIHGAKRMENGKLHFELADGNRIRVPKDDSTFVSVHVDVDAITSADQTGKRLDLSLDTTVAENGVESLTSATGADLSATAVSGDALGQEFVAYRSEISVNHVAAGSQPQFSDPSAASQEVYRFTVTSDAARQTELGRVSLSMNVQGMQKTAAANFVAGDFVVRQVKTDGTIDSTATVANVALPVAGTATAAELNVDFIDQSLTAGSSRTYAVFVANTENDGGDVDDDSFSFTILRDTVYAAPDTRANQIAASSLVWSDESATNHSDTTEDWLNGYLVEIDTSAYVNED